MAQVSLSKPSAAEPDPPRSGKIPAIAVASNDNHPVVGPADSVQEIIPPTIKATPEAAQETPAITGELPDIHFIPDLGLKLIWIKPGSFVMGNAQGGEIDEKPVTQVSLTRGFWLGQTEVTQAQWRAIMGNNPAHFQGDDLPVETVSWNEAMEFCQKLSDREGASGLLPKGYAFTLPTEAQWEFACRAGTTGDYEGDPDTMGWYAANSSNTTKPVGQKQANAWGLCDMHGNVWEWCLDLYGSYRGGNVTDPKGAALGPYRVMRGGSWNNSADYCRANLRLRDEPIYRRNYLGLRLALSPLP